MLKFSLLQFENATKIKDARGEHTSGVDAFRDLLAKAIPELKKEIEIKKNQSTIYCVLHESNLLLVSSTPDRYHFVDINLDEDEHSVTFKSIMKKGSTFEFEADQINRSIQGGFDLDILETVNSIGFSDNLRDNNARVALQTVLDGFESQEVVSAFISYTQMHQFTPIVTFDFIIENCKELS
jgi:hypothetical protein